MTTSIKGVLLVDQRVVLVKNERDEWELPGGRAEAGETDQMALAREFAEELAVQIQVQSAIDSYVFEVVPNRNVRIVTYGCMLAGPFAPRVSEEHSECSVFALDELARLRLPEGYRRSIERWSSRANITDIERAVLDSFTHDFEAPHTVAEQLTKSGDTPAPASRLRDALLSLAAKGLLQAHVIDSAGNEYVPISAGLAAAREDAWFSDGRVRDHRKRR